jgi:hypothetical protein
MVLEKSMIELLQKTIDENIAQIPVISTLLRNENIPWSKLEIRNESDFILGAVFSQILCQYSYFFLNRCGRGLAVDEVLETDGIVLDRAEDIKKGIRNLGI